MTILTSLLYTSNVGTYLTVDKYNWLMSNKDKQIIDEL